MHLVACLHSNRTNLIIFYPEQSFKFKVLHKDSSLDKGIYIKKVFMCTQVFLDVISKFDLDKSLQHIKFINMSEEALFRYAICFPHRIATDKYYLRNQKKITKDTIKDFYTGLEKRVSDGFDEGLCFGYACCALEREWSSYSKVRYFQAFHSFQIRTRESYEMPEFPKLQRDGNRVFVDVDRPSHKIVYFYDILQSIVQDEILLSLESDECAHLIYVNFKEEYLADNGTVVNAPAGIEFKLFLNAYVHLEYHYPCTHFGILPVRVDVTPFGEDLFYLGE